MSFSPSFLTPNNTSLFLQKKTVRQHNVVANRRIQGWPVATEPCSPTTVAVLIDSSVTGSNTSLCLRGVR
jgi:hypothetical protein